MLKFSMLAFYIRLTEGVGGTYRMQIFIGFGLVAGTCMASLLTIFLSCRPLHKYWQIYPNPGSALFCSITTLLLCIYIYS